ncbi:hypothetical protein SprV_0100396500 [Sparganum proliferum]
MEGRSPCQRLRESTRLTPMDPVCVPLEGESGWEARRHEKYDDWPFFKACSSVSLTRSARSDFRSPAAPPAHLLP